MVWPLCGLSWNASRSPSLKRPNMTLADLSDGMTAKITGYADGDRSLRRRLLSLGLTKGAIVTFVKRAPMGDPVILEIRDYQVSLRQATAALVNVVIHENNC